MSDYYKNPRRTGPGMTADRLPPHDTEIEATVLGMIVNSPTQVMQDVERLGINSRSFYDLRHQAIYRVIQTLLKEEMVPDLITLSKRLSEEGKVEDAGGLPYLTALPHLPTAPVEQYVKQLHDLRQRRQLIQYATTIHNCAHDPLEPLAMRVSETSPS